jgi:hypothetical protein
MLQDTFWENVCYTLYFYYLSLSSLETFVQKDKLYRKASCTERQVVQKDKLYRKASCTERQVVQKDKLYRKTSCTERQVVQNLKIALKLDEQMKKFKFSNLVMFISIPWRF